MTGRVLTQGSRDRRIVKSGHSLKYQKEEEISKQIIMNMLTACLVSTVTQSLQVIGINRCIRIPSLDTYLYWRIYTHHQSIAVSIIHCCIQWLKNTTPECERHAGRLPSICDLGFGFNMVRSGVSPVRAFGVVFIYTQNK